MKAVMKEPERTLEKTDETAEKEFLETWRAGIEWLSKKTTEKEKLQPELAKFQEMNFTMMSMGITHYKSGFYDALNLMHEWGKI